MRAGITGMKAILSVGVGSELGAPFQNPGKHREPTFGQEQGSSLFHWLCLLRLDRILAGAGGSKHLIELLIGAQLGQHGVVQQV